MTDAHPIHCFLDTEQKTAELAHTFAHALKASAPKLVQTAPEKPPGLVVFLHGDLGAGKSFFSRALIQTFLPNQKVKSPTYTLVETYTTEAGDINHFDLYRLCDPEELEFLGFRELLSKSLISLIEWPSKGEGVLPSPDIEIELTPEGEGRNFTLKSLSEKGNNLVKNLSV